MRVRSTLIFMWYTAALQEGGRNFFTIGSFLEAAKAAYAAKQPCARFGSTQPEWARIDATYDFLQYIEGWLQPGLGGWGHAVQIQEDDDTGEVLFGRRASEIHNLQFYSHEGACIYPTQD
jgi:hypothetical protein